MDDFAPPPEAQLIERRRLALPKQRSAIAKVAKEAGISEGRWRQIAKGYQQVDKSTRALVRAPAETLARMAFAVGATAGDLHEAGRGDAAEELEVLGEKQRAAATGIRVTPRVDMDLGHGEAMDFELEVIGDGWQSVVELADAVKSSNPSEELLEKTRRIVFVMSGYLIIRILQGGHPAALEKWLDRIYVERRQLYQELWRGDGEPDYPWYTAPGRPEYGGSPHTYDDNLMRSDAPPSQDELDLVARTAPPRYQPGESEQGDAHGEEPQVDVEHE